MESGIKDPDVLWLLDVFIDHPVPWTRSGKGLPIGNLTNQNFANFYLSGLDHYIKEELRIEGYVRYMDDMVLWADEKDTLRDAADRVVTYLHRRLRLRIKSGSLLLAPVFQGLPFLGFRIFPGVIRIDRRGWRRFRRRVNAVSRRLEEGVLDDDTWQRSMASLVGHLRQGQTRNLRAPFFKGQGHKRHQPGDTRRQLGQRCAQLPFGQSQQQLARQPQPQSGLSPRQLTATVRCSAFTDAPPVPKP